MAAAGAAVLAGRGRGGAPANLEGAGCLCREGDGVSSGHGEREMALRTSGTAGWARGTPERAELAGPAGDSGKARGREAHAAEERHTRIVPRGLTAWEPRGDQRATRKMRREFAAPGVTGPRWEFEEPPQEGDTRCRVSTRRRAHFAPRRARGPPGHTRPSALLGPQPTDSGGRGAGRKAVRRGRGAGSRALSPLRGWSPAFSSALPSRPGPFDAACPRSWGAGGAGGERDLP